MIWLILIFAVILIAVVARQFYRLGIYRGWLFAHNRLGWHLQAKTEKILKRYIDSY